MSAEDTTRCWRSECRNGCYYADVCSIDYRPEYAPHECAHLWLDRPKSDTHECLICGAEGSGSPLDTADRIARDGTL